MHLNSEQLQGLRDLMSHDHFKDLLAVMEAVCSAQEADVIKLQLADGHQHILDAKARAEGSRRHLTAVKLELQRIKTTK